MKALIMPGQGAQIVGMGKILYEEHKVARDVFDEVDEALQFKLSKIIFEGPEDLLNITSNTQPALMAVSMALIKTIEYLSRKPINNFFNVLAGHSLGQYTALAAASSINIFNTAKVLYARGDFMQNSCPLGYGSMAACLNIAITDLEKIIEESKHIGPIDIANDNAKDQIVISGTTSAIDYALSILQSQGKKAIKLKVSAPFHSILMDKAAKSMQEYLDNSSINFLPPKIPVIDNTSLEWIKDNTNIKSLLVNQIMGRVRWRETMETLDDNNFSQVVECGPNATLSKINKRSGYKFNAISITSTEEIEAYLLANY